MATRRQPRVPREQPKKVSDDDYTIAYVVTTLILVVFTYFILFGGNQSPPIPIDPVTLCPTDEQRISRKTYILIDLSEPLLPEQRAELQRLLSATVNNLIAREQLSISQMQALQNDPREEVQRFCSPDIGRVGQAGSRVKTEDCPDILNDKFSWHPGIGNATRDDIRTACNDYSKLKKKVVEASEPYNSGNLEQSRSYIVGALEDIMHGANEEPSNVPTTLIVFSDMLQNADWFSQYRKSHGEWTIENLLERRGHANNMGTKPDNNFKNVLLCYLPSTDRILATESSVRKHKKMWRDYFEKTINFDDINYSGCSVVVKALARSS